MVYQIPRNEEGQVMEKIGAFEICYPKYAFAPLVEFGIWVASFLSGRTCKFAAAHDGRSIAGNSLGSAA